jgi:hypothetical protein
MKCTDRDRWPRHDWLHAAACPMSRAMVSRRQGRICALTPAEMRSALTFLSGWTPTGTDCALGDADALRECRECHEDAPGHTAQCTLRPGAPPVAVLVPADMPEGAL